MRVHFSTTLGSYPELHKQIVNSIISLGHELVTNHYITRSIEDVKLESDKESSLYVSKYESWIRSADAVIFEVTREDASIGYEIAKAMDLLKPTILMYHKDFGKEPIGLKGIHSDRLQIVDYSEHNLLRRLNNAIQFAQKDMNVKFNLFFSSQMNAYVEKEAKKRGLSKSAFVRRLITEHQRGKIII